jgi:hypothetical protein
MKASFKTLALAGIIALFSTACDKDDQDDQNPTNSTANLSVKVEYVFGSAGAPWSIGDWHVHPKTGDSLRFEEFKFYISNLKLRKEDGTWWEAPNSYHLVDAKTSVNGAFLLSVPAGTYDYIEYTMGVDSSRVVNGPYDGDLDPSMGMYFGTQEGYTMLMASGTSPHTASGQFSFELTGYQGEYNLVMERSSSLFGETREFRGGEDHSITLKANPARMWHASPSVAQLPQISGGGADAKAMAEYVFNNISLFKVE